MGAQTAHIALKIAVASSPSVDLFALFEKVTSASEDNHFDQIMIGELEVLRVQKSYAAADGGQTICTTLRAITGEYHYHAMQEALLSNADGILFMIDLDPSQYQANMQVMLHTAQTLRLQGSDPGEMPMVFLYMENSSTSSELIQQWDHLLEIERNQWPRFISSTKDTRSIHDAIDLLTGKIISLPRLRVIA